MGVALKPPWTPDKRWLVWVLPRQWPSLLMRAMLVICESHSCVCLFQNYSVLIFLPLGGNPSYSAAVYINIVGRGRKKPKGNVHAQRHEVIPRQNKADLVYPMEYSEHCELFWSKRAKQEVLIQRNIPDIRGGGGSFGRSQFWGNNCRSTFV